MRRVLCIGGSFAGLCVGRDLKDGFLVTLVDAKEYFEYTPGVLRAYVKTKHLDALTFNLQPVIESRMGCHYIWGEVTALNGADKTATIKPMFVDKAEVIDFDYCVIACGCNFGPFHKWGESLWFPTVHAQAREEGSWPEFDERFLEGRRRHILAENQAIKELNDKSASILVIGAGFIGVEWITELDHFFPKLNLSIIDMLPLPLGPLPEKAAQYCVRYMQRHKINQHYGKKYDAKSKDFWASINLPNGVDKDYMCMGVKASNYFMPEETLSAKGPGGGKWILIKQNLGVMTRDGQPWGTDSKGNPRIFAVGDCNLGGIEEYNKAPNEWTNKKPDEWDFPPVPKISYPGEEEAFITLRNIEKLDKMLYHGKETDCCGYPYKVSDMHWPWGAGMFATSLGPGDACFVAGANWQKGSGLMVLRGQLSAVQKEVIEASKIDECQMGLIGRYIWHFVHHTPIHLWGGGPLLGY